MIPFFGWRRNIVPFVILLALAYASPLSVFLAPLFGLAFYLILGIKELVFVDRPEAFRGFTLAVLFIACLDLYGRFDFWLTDAGRGTLAFVAAFCVSALFFILGKEYAAHLGGMQAKIPAAMAVSAMSFIVWQIATAVLFLPTAVLSQTAITYGVIVFLLEILPDYLQNRLKRQKVLIMSCTLAAMMVIVLVAASWGFGPQ